MDKSLELILVAAVIVITAAIAITMFQGQAGILPNFTDSQINPQECKTEIKRECASKSSGEEFTVPSVCDEIKGDVTVDGNTYSSGDAGSSKNC